MNLTERGRKRQKNRATFFSMIVTSIFVCDVICTIIPYLTIRLFPTFFFRKKPKRRRTNDQ